MAADLIKWPSTLDLRDFEQMAELIIAVGCYDAEDLMDFSASGRAQLCIVLSDGRPGWARLLREMRGAGAPRTEVGIKRPPHQRSGHICHAQGK